MVANNIEMTDSMGAMLLLNWQLGRLPSAFHVLITEAIAVLSSSVVLIM